MYSIVPGKKRLSLLANKFIWKNILYNQLLLGCFNAYDDKLENITIEEIQKTCRDSAALVSEWQQESIQKQDWQEARLLSETIRVHLKIAKDAKILVEELTNLGFIACIKTK
jgi:hypothetical protein